LTDVSGFSVPPLVFFFSFCVADHFRSRSLFSPVIDDRLHRQESLFCNHFSHRLRFALTVGELSLSRAPDFFFPTPEWSLVFPVFPTTIHSFLGSARPLPQACRSRFFSEWRREINLFFLCPMPFVLFTQIRTCVEPNPCSRCRSFFSPFRTNDDPQKLLGFVNSLFF